MPKSKPGCFSGIIRRIFCTGNVQKHPSSPSPSPSPSPLDHITTKPNNAIKMINNQDSGQQDHHQATTSKRQSGPTLVAKLMGLDSLPPNPDFGFALKPTAPESIPRSKSLNFEDYLSKLHVAESRTHGTHHRRVRSSASFREVTAPTTSFHRNDTSETSQKKGARVKGKRENEKRISKLKSEPRRKASEKICKRKSGGLGSVLPRETKCSQRNGYGVQNLKASKPENGKKVTEKFVRKRKNPNGNKKIQTIESNQENLSPVSVLDDALFSG